MALPGVSETISDGGLGVLPGSSDGVTALLGVSSSGTAGTIYSFTNQNKLVSTLGEGPLVEAAAYHIAQSGKQVYCVPINGSVVASNSAVTAVGGGPAVSVAGSAKDTFEVYVWINGTGALGVGTFQYSLDAGNTYSPTITIPSGGSYVINYPKLTPAVSTGLTLTFPAGTYNAGNSYSFTATPAGFTTSDATTAWNALVADPRTWEFVHLVGAATSAANSATMATTIESLNASAETNHRFVWNCIECAADTDSNIITAVASVSASHTALAAGYCQLLSPINGLIYRRPIAWPALARTAKIPLSQEAAEVSLGSLPGVVSLAAVTTVAGTTTTPPAGTLFSPSGYRDEAVTPGLDAARVLTARSLVGAAGFFPTRSALLSAAGSDFVVAPYRRVINKATTIARATLLPKLNSRIPPDPSTGNLPTRVAAAFAKLVEGQIKAAMKSDITSVSCAVDAPNLLSTATVNVTIRIIPLGYANQITIDIGFRNPALGA